jgi:thiol-disulfide isomerase/thioredoxin
MVYLFKCDYGHAEGNGWSPVPIIARPANAIPSVVEDRGRALLTVQSIALPTDMAEYVRGRVDRPRRLSLASRPHDPIRPLPGVSDHGENRVLGAGCHSTNSGLGESIKMRRASFAAMVIVLVATAAPGFLRVAQAQPPGNDKAAPPSSRTTESTKVDEELQAIDDRYNRELLQLDLRRLEALGVLAASQKPDRAAITYERLFRLAIAGDLFRNAEAVATRVLEQGSPSPTTHTLAHVVKIVALVDRGDAEGSLRSLRQAVADSTRDRPATEARSALSPSEIIAICEAYYQRLVDGNHFQVARDAFRHVLEQPYDPAVKEFLAGRLRRIELVGKPAPPIQGTDLDGKAFDLAAEKGKVVLVVFWASWSLPNAAQIMWLEQAQDAYHNRGLDVVGINLDVVPNGGPKLETVLPNIRRFLLDYNVPWPTLVNGSGDRDYAKAYGVADIPANVLIGRDGNVVQIDVSRRNLETVLTKHLGP